MQYLSISFTDILIIFEFMSVVEDNEIKIFLAEDDEDDRLLFREAMNEVNRNIPVIECFDGVHLLESLGEEVGS